MKNIDVFNGDADGICALLQLRLAAPKDSTLITGVKRDIKLLQQVEAGEGDKITVLDISMEKNQADLQRLLQRGTSVFYVDHHLSGDIPQHENLHAIIDTSPTVCTSLLVNQYLDNPFAKWAVTGAYGDNMLQSAVDLGKQIGLKDEEAESLKQLGTLINYNGYGSTTDDLLYHPAELYQALLEYADPLDCIADVSSPFHKLSAGYESDIANTTQLKPEYSTEKVAVFMLPDDIWARRVSGVFGNQLSNEHPDRAHAIVTHHPQGGYVISVRAPQNRLEGAGELCSEFPTGGGRKGAAGINQLPVDQLPHFIDRFTATYS